MSSLTRRQFMQWSGMFALGTTLSACSAAAGFTAEPTAEPTPEPAITSPDEALQRLLDGNQRYVNNRTVDPNQSETRRVEVAAGQNPFAIVLGCVDSRVPPEIVFDRGLGDLFVIRTAGQVVDQAVLGSIEFGVGHYHVPLIFVLGHESCGAVTAAMEAHGEAEGSIGYLVEAITPAIEATQGQEGDPLDNAVKANVALVMEQLSQSPLLSEAITTGTLKIVGGRYDLDKGAIELV